MSSYNKRKWKGSRESEREKKGLKKKRGAVVISLSNNCNLFLQT